MSAVAPITRQTVGRTFIFAGWTLVVGFVVQVGAIGWLFHARFRATPLPPAPPGATSLLGPPPQLGLNATDPFPEEKLSAEDTPLGGDPLVGGSVPAPPRPVPLNAPGIARSPADEAQERFHELVEQARVLRERGDPYSAVTRLKEAQALDDKNPLATAELAFTYEKMGFAGPAAEAWGKVYEMGESAGVYYAAAEAHRKLQQEQTMRKLEGQAGTPAGQTPAAPVDAGGGEGEKVGLDANCKLGLGNLARKEETAPNVIRKFTLQVPIKARHRARIDVRDVTVQVMFYDVVNDKQLDRTTATVSYKWASPPADWADGDVEQLEVSYSLPMLRATDEDRKYYGYLVSVYYRNALQDFRSDPPALAQRAPPLKTLSPETPSE